MSQKYDDFVKKNDNDLFLQKHDSYRTYEVFAQSDKNVCVSEKIPEAPIRPYLWRLCQKYVCVAKNGYIFFVPQKHSSCRTYEEFAQSQKQMCGSETIQQAPDPTVPMKILRNITETCCFSNSPNRTVSIGIVSEQQAILLPETGPREAQPGEKPRWAHRNLISYVRASIICAARRSLGHPQINGPLSEFYSKTRKFFFAENTPKKYCVRTRGNLCVLDVSWRPKKSAKSIVLHIRFASKS